MKYLIRLEAANIAELTRLNGEGVLIPFNKINAKVRQIWEELSDDESQ
ncbi:MAG: hypothetical protein KME43_11290 [Myxacorys chilensis ATA2-1-KO14]|jgi:hypothetical protein|nr:hypothetical protein [Myxacorys chilensis ATA2-1-KO14]